MKLGLSKSSRHSWLGQIMQKENSQLELENRAEPFMYLY